MDTRLTLAIIVMIVLPALFFAASVLMLRTKWFSARSRALLRISVLDKSILLSQDRVARIFLAGFVYLWLDMFMPTFVPLFVVTVLLMGLGLASIERVQPESLAKANASLLRRLKVMQSQIGDVRSQIQGLGIHLASQDRELQDKSQMRKQLDDEIEAKSGEAQFWQRLTEGERQIVATAAASVLPKPKKDNVFVGIFLGCLASLLASVVWSLMGNPGAEKIYQRLGIPVKASDNMTEQTQPSEPKNSLR